MSSHIILLILVSLFFSALFSGVEIAFITIDRLFVELQSNKGGRRDIILAKFKNNPEMFIATMLVGNTLVLVYYGLLMARATEPFISATLSEFIPPNYVELTTLISQTIISTLVVLATAEFLPKSLFLISPYKVLKTLIYPTLFAYYILYPFVWLIVKMSQFLIIKVLKQSNSGQATVYGLTDLNNYLNEMVSKNNDDKDDNIEVDTEMFTNAIAFQKVKVRDCMIPRTEITAIDVSESIEELQQQFIDTTFSKILVYKENIDEIIGYVHHSKMFKKPKTIKEAISNLVIAPETMLINDLMIEFSKERKSIALVVDEYGGTAGLVTMEDIVEEIFGEIHDEYDQEHLLEEKLGEDEWLLSARHEISYLNEHLNLSIPEGDYDTLGGFILWISGNIPSQYERIQHHEFTFIIKAMEGVKIDKVLLSVNKMDEKLD